MNNENKIMSCNCKQVEWKLVSLLNDNSSLLEIIQELKKEIERLKDELTRSGTAQAGLRPDTAAADNNNAEVLSLIEVNHGWKRDYEELQMRFDMLSGEKKLLEEEERELKERVCELETRQGPLKSEITRLAAALYRQDSSTGYRAGQEQRPASSCDQEYDLLKTQITLYKEDFESERRDRQSIHEEKTKLEEELEGAEEIIKKLTTELDACKARTVRHIQSENGYVGLRERNAYGGARHGSYPPAASPMSEQRWRYEQNRRGILPRNPPPTSFFYGGDVEVDNYEV